MKRKSHSRSRTRSRSRDRSTRDRHKNQKHAKKTSHRRSRSRSRSPRHHTRSSRSPKNHHKRSARSPSPPISLTLGGSLTIGNMRLKRAGDEQIAPMLDPQAYEGKSVEEIQMMKMMGFSTFDTTKGKHVDGACNASGVNIQQKRRYRQYMNRKGGFNRPLDPVA